ncbi:Rhodanese domain protein, partial [mine drainage metagenome]
ELRARMEAGSPPRLIDVREDWEYQKGHIPGSEHLPLSRFIQAYPTLPKNQELVIVCESGSRSGQAAQFLSGQGYGSVHNLVGGMSAWRRGEPRR